MTAPWSSPHHIGGPFRFRVVELTPDDWPMWRELRLAALADSPDAFGSTLADWSGAGDHPERWRARLADVDLNLVLSLDETPLGQLSALAPAIAVPGDEPTAAVELISFWIDPRARGNGGADLLVEHARGWARANYPAHEVGLCVKANNSRAIRAYAKLGFVDIGPSPEDPSERLMRRR